MTFNNCCTPLSFFFLMLQVKKISVNVTLTQAFTILVRRWSTFCKLLNYWVFMKISYISSVWVTSTISLRSKFSLNTSNGLLVFLLPQLPHTDVLHTFATQYQLHLCLYIGYHSYCLSICKSYLPFYLLSNIWTLYWVMAHAYCNELLHWLNALLCKN